VINPFSTRPEAEDVQTIVIYTYLCHFIGKGSLEGFFCKYVNIILKHGQLIIFCGLNNPYPVIAIAKISIFLLDIWTYIPHPLNLFSILLNVLPKYPVWKTPYIKAQFYKKYKDKWWLLKDNSKMLWLKGWIHCPVFSVRTRDMKGDSNSRNQSYKKYMETGGENSYSDPEAAVSNIRRRETRLWLSSCLSIKISVGDQWRDNFCRRSSLPRRHF